MKQMVFAEGLSCIDFINPTTGKSAINGETLEQVRVRYPEAEIIEVYEFIDKKEKTLCSDPVEITEEKYIEMLEVLPPDNWIRKNGESSFELCEHLSGRVTSIYCVVEGKYFSFSGIAGSSHEDKIARCKKVLGIA